MRNYHCSLRNNPDHRCSQVSCSFLDCAVQKEITHIHTKTKTWNFSVLDVRLWLKSRDMRLRRLQENSIADKSVCRNVECLLLATFNWRVFQDLRRRHSHIFWHVFHCNISWHALSFVNSYLVTRNCLAVTPSKFYLPSKGGPGLVVAYHFRIYCLTGGWYELLHVHSSAPSQEQDLFSVASPCCELCRFRFVCASCN